MIEEFFRTKRLVFRPFAPEDLDALAAIVADPEVMAYVDERQPMPRATAALWIERSRENVARFGYGTGAVIEAATGAFIGWAGFARPEGDPEEIIYGFAKPAWNRGYGAEIAEALVWYAFQDLDHGEVRATTYAENLASHRILRTLGFEQRPFDEEGVMLWVLER